MVRFLMMLFLLSPFLSFSQEDGPYKKYFDNGQLKTNGQYKNQKQIGEWKSFYRTGALSSVYSYTNGKRNKDFKSFYENGTLKSETSKVGDVFISKRFYESGNLFYERLYNTGYYKEYYDGGNLKIESNYNDFELDGLWKSFDGFGNKLWEVNYVDGYLEGFYRQYFINGILKVAGSHEKNKKNGQEIHYDESGNQINEIKYKKGKLVKFDNENTIGVIVPRGLIEQVPVYPGCEKIIGNREQKKCMNTKVAEFVSREFNTDVATKYGVPGDQKVRINIIFKIDKLGNVIDVDAKSPHPKFSEEAIRIINLLPKMKPGFQDGKNVIVPFSLPILFSIAPIKGYNKD